MPGFRGIWGSSVRGGGKLVWGAARREQGMGLFLGIFDICLYRKCFESAKECFGHAVQPAQVSLRMICSHMLVRRSGFP